MSGLAQRQAELVAALVAGAAVPAGFDPVLVDAARSALLRKRAGEVARVWPMLAASFGSSWPRAFASWAASRPTQGALRDGWDFAASLSASSLSASSLSASSPSLTGAAAAEYAGRQAVSRYDGRSAPTPRRRVAAAVRLRWVRVRHQI